VVLFGFFPALRELPGSKGPLAMPTVIELVMLSVAAVMLVATKVPWTRCRRRDAARRRGGGDRHLRLAWLGDSFIAANQSRDRPAISAMTQAAPWTFALGSSPRPSCSTARRRPRAR
jgi:anaerobic C4-dicarboxylate transporter DcuA